MLLFQKRFHEGLVAGTTVLTFRRWEKPHVKPGGRYRCHPIGVLEVFEVDVVRVTDITAEEAVGAGFTSRDELLAYLQEAKTDAKLTARSEVYRVRLRHGGDGDRVEGALVAELGKEDVAEIRRRLARFDEISPTGPWTRRTLGLIAKNPRVAASRLAERLGREKLAFKADVVKLKRLGLTQSFEVGYELSPRGVAYLATRTARPKAPRG